MRSLVVIALAACNSPAKPAELDGVALHKILTTDEVHRVETIRILPDHGNARYVILWKDRGKPSEALAEFPGTFTDEMVTALVPYTVGPVDGHSISMTEFRAALQCGAHQPRCDAATAITAVKILKLDQGARYELTRAGATVFAFGEYPGHVIDELRASAIPFSE